jgi:hypothetical protein
MECEGAPQAAVTVRRTWSWGKGGAAQEWGVVLRGLDGVRHVVTASTPEGVGAAVTAHLLTLHAAQDAA